MLPWSGTNGSDGLGQPWASMARQNERSASVSEVHHAAVRAKLNKHCYHQHLGSLVFLRGHEITWNIWGKPKNTKCNGHFEWFVLNCLVVWVVNIMTSVCSWQDGTFAGEIDETSSIENCGWDVSLTMIVSSGTIMIIWSLVTTAASAKHPKHWTESKWHSFLWLEADVKVVHWCRPGSVEHVWILMA